jgi:hypothetical protein
MEKAKTMEKTRDESKLKRDERDARDERRETRDTRISKAPEHGKRINGK